MLNITITDIHLDWMWEFPVLSIGYGKVDSKAITEPHWNQGTSQQRYARMPSPMDRISNRIRK